MANRAPLRRIGAAAARVPSSAPRLSSNSFKTLPTTARHQEDLEDDHDGDDSQEMGSSAADMQSSTPTTDTSTAVSSPCVTHVETAALRRGEGKSSPMSFHCLTSILL